MADQIRILIAKQIFSNVLLEKIKQEVSKMLQNKTTTLSIEEITKIIKIPNKCAQIE